MTNKTTTGKADKVSFRRKAYRPSMEHTSSPIPIRYDQAPFLRTIVANLIDLISVKGAITVTPGATNSLSNSALTTGWTMSGTMVKTANYGIAPDGTKTSTLLGATASRQSWLYTRRDYTAISEAVPHCYSVYVRKPANATSQEFTIIMSNNAGITTQSYWMLVINGQTVTLKDGGVRATSGAVDVPRDGGWGYEYVGDGWFRVWCWVLWSTASTYARTPMALFYPSVSLLSTVNDVCEVWGAQVEVGKKPSRPIIATSSTVTRASGTLTLHQPIKNASTTFFSFKRQQFDLLASWPLVFFFNGSTRLFTVRQLKNSLILVGATEVSIALQSETDIEFGVIFNNNKLRIIAPDGTVSAEVNSLSTVEPNNMVVQPATGAGELSLKSYITVDGVVVDSKMVMNYLVHAKNN